MPVDDSERVTRCLDIIHVEPNPGTTPDSKILKDRHQQVLPCSARSTYDTTCFPSLIVIREFLVSHLHLLRANCVDCLKWTLLGRGRTL